MIFYTSQTERFSFADHITANGELTQEDIDKASSTVADQLKKIKTEFKLLEE